LKTSAKDLRIPKLKPRNLNEEMPPLFPDVVLRNVTVEDSGGGEEPT